MHWIRPYRLKNRFFTGLLHIALATIIVGGCVTHFFGQQGEIHLRADKAQTLNYQSPITNHQSAVTLFLWDFQVVYDEDGKTPVDFISELRLLNRGGNKETQGLAVDEGVVRMNKPLKYHGFRFFQSDYDSDLQGVVFSYNYDPWGIGITYTGYALLLLAMIGFFFQKNTLFRALLQKQHTWWMVGLGIAAVVLAIVMTKVVTPKPPLQPVLQTPLLGIHVSVIMLAYTLFAVMMINGLIGLYAAIVSRKAEGARKAKLSTLNSQLSTFNFITDTPLPGSFLPHCRNLHRCGMGEYVVGTILGMGSQGDMGTHHHAGICAIDSLALAKEQITNHQQPITNHLPYPLYCRLPLRPVHLFWSELLLLRSAFVCLTDAVYYP